MSFGYRAFDRAIVSAELGRDIAQRVGKSAPLERPAGFAYAGGCNDFPSETFLFRRKTRRLGHHRVCNHSHEDSAFGRRQ
jgi:hypothetical protein